jgi:hypothetical protein
MELELTHMELVLLRRLLAATETNLFTDETKEGQINVITNVLPVNSPPFPFSSMRTLKAKVDTAIKRIE